MRRRSLLVSCLLLLVVLACVPAYLFWLYQPDRNHYPLRGIDVSHHQGTIDWSKVAGDDVAFVYIKASEGKEYRDPQFAENRKQAEAVGLPVGAYHYFTFCRSGKEQAANFLGALEGDGTALPAALDLEFVGNCEAQPAQGEMKQQIADFLSEVETSTGQPVIFYVTAEFLSRYANALPDRPLWVRSLFSEPGRWSNAPRQSDWNLWQYHFAGHVNGIAGRVDLNVVRPGTPLFEQVQSGSQRR